MIKIGITGGIASGKTTATNYLKKRNCYIFNADKESKGHLKKSLSLQKKIISILDKNPWIKTKMVIVLLD